MFTVRRMTLGVIWGMVAFAVGTVLYLVYRVHILTIHDQSGVVSGIDVRIFKQWTYRSPVYWLVFLIFVVLGVWAMRNRKR